MSNERVSRLITDIGRAGLHYLYPNDFEYYLMALELVNGDDETIDYFAFPVTPEITQREPKLINLVQTMGGVTFLSSSTVFTPKQITLRGDFGRKFRVLLNRNGDAYNFSAIRFTGVKNKEDLIQNANSLKKATFDPVLKTGYGCIKILQSICEKSDGLDEKGRPFKLYLYNMALGESYWVKVMDLTLTGEKSKNTLWQFNLSLQAIGRLESLFGDSKKSMLKRLSIQQIQTGVNILTSTLYKEVTKDTIRNDGVRKARNSMEHYYDRRQTTVNIPR